MAKGIYLGIDSLSRKVKKMYLGIEGVARKVKKGYIGINGIARLFFAGGGKPVYAGETTPLPVLAARLAGASVSKYALFAGGTRGTSLTGTPNNQVTAYDDVQVQSIPDHLNSYAVELAGCSLPNHAIFAGGEESDRQVNAYDKNLSKISPAEELEYGRGYMPTAKVGDYAVFGPGFCTEPSFVIRNFTEAYDDDMVHYQCPSVSGSDSNSRYITGAANQNYAVFSGAATLSGQATGVTKALDADLTVTTATPGKSSFAKSGATVGDDQYAMFVGGTGSTGNWGPHSYAYAYDNDLVFSECEHLTEARSLAAAVSLYGTAIFAGGQISEDKGTALVETYEEDLVKGETFSLQSARYELAGAVAGVTAIIAGGYINESYAVATTQADLIKT